MSIDQATTQNNLVKVCTACIWFGVLLGLFGDSVGLLLFAIATHDQNAVAANVIMSAFWFIPAIVTSYIAYNRFRRITS